MGSKTWIESWQGVESEGCGLPVDPHNGSNTQATYTLNDQDIIINGRGAHIGLAKVTNQGELTDNSISVPTAITYSITAFSSDGNSMTVEVNYGAGV